MVASKSALVAPILIAMPSTWIISPASGPTMWQPTHAIGRAVDHELHQRARLAADEHRLHRPERGLVDVDPVEALARLRLGQPDDADLRLGEHRGRHVGVVDLDRLAAEHRVGERMALADRDRRQRERGR